MTLIGNNKPIKAARFDKSTSSIYIVDFQHDENYIKSSDLKNITTNTKFEINIPTNSTLYFTKSSKIPRVQLQNTELKRCIKKEKADYLVINTDFPTTYSRMEFYETDDAIYIISDWRISSSNLQTFLGKHVDWIREAVYSISKDSAETINLILENKYKLVTDSEVNKIIDSAGPTITKDDLNSIISMLNGDDDVVGLGLKTLAQFNIDATPLTIKTMLMLNTKWAHNQAKTQIEVKNLLSKLNLPSYGSFRFPHDFYYSFKNKQYSDYDKELAKDLIINRLKTTISNDLNHCLKVADVFGITVKIDIE